MTLSPAINLQAPTFSEVNRNNNANVTESDYTVGQRAKSSYGGQKKTTKTLLMEREA